MQSIKKFLITLLTACMFITIMPSSLFAQSNSNEKVTMTISTARQWNRFAANVRNGNTYAGKLIKLTADITFDESTLLDFGTAGTGNAAFSGTFDGNNHSIKGIDYILNDIYSSGESAGLFPYLSESGIIKNLSVKDSKIKAEDSEYCGMIAGTNYGIIDNCNTINSEVIGGNATGGIAGCNNNIISNCSNSGTVLCNNTGSSFTHIKTIVGGIAGYNVKNIYNCYNVGNISSIYNFNRTSSTGYYTNACMAGGIVGKNIHGAVINNCYNTGKIEAINNYDETDAYHSGIAGIDDEGIIRNCYWDEVIALLPYNSDNSNTNETNVRSMTLSDMCGKSFVNILNAKRGSQSTWSRWIYTGDTPIHAPTYEVKFIKVTNGLSKTNYSYANEGQTVTLTISPKSKTYKKITVTIKSDSGKTIKATKKNTYGTKYTFKMPDSSVKVTINCKKK